MKKNILLIIAFILCFTLLTNPKPIQQKKSETQLQYEITVTLKLVQVYVADKNGNPVTDLAKDEFILYDNGKLQTITDFEKHLLIKPEKQIEEEIAKTELPPAEDVSSRMNRKFFLLLDLFQNNVGGIVRSKKAALHFIDSQLQPSDEVGVLSYSRERGLIINEYLTNDHQKIRDAVKKIKGVPGKTEVTKDEEGEWMKMRIRRFATELKDFAKALRYIPGFKNIIFFSAGVSRSWMYGENEPSDTSGMKQADPGIRETYEEMSKELAASNSPVHTVNTEGTRDILEQGMSGRGDHSLKMMSDLSGGMYFSDVEYYEKIAEEIQSMTSNYYVLGYYIDEKWDGKHHDIKVKVKREGCEVYAQGGYFNPKPFSEFSEFEKKLHLIDLALSEKPYFQEPLRFSLTTLPCSPRKVSNLVLLSEMPLYKMKDIIRQKTEMVTLILDRDNNIVDSSQGEIDFSSIPHKTIYHYKVSSLLPGDYQCCLIIRNLKTGMGAVASSSVTIPESFDSGIRLFPPLLLIPEKEASYLKITKASKEKIESEYPSLTSIYHFLSNKNSPLLDELDRGISTLFGVVLCSIVNIQKPEVDLTANLSDEASGKIIPLTISIISSKSKEETDILLIDLQLPELQPGKYSLEIIAKEITSNSSSKASRTFIVK
jgi:VWFA-related protein